MTLSTYEWIGLFFSVISIIVIPCGLYLIRSMLHWAQLESKIDAAINDIKDLVLSKDQVHETLWNEIRTDRAATNQRLRWLEEHLWKGGR